MEEIVLVATMYQALCSLLETQWYVGIIHLVCVHKKIGKIVINQNTYTHTYAHTYTANREKSSKFKEVREYITKRPDPPWEGLKKFTKKM